MIRMPRIATWGIGQSSMIKEDIITRYVRRQPVPSHLPSYPYRMFEPPCSGRVSRNYIPDTDITKMTMMASLPPGPRPGVCKQDNLQVCQGCLMILIGAVVFFTAFKK